nr:hypothetical protein [Tanacetum cinerariifolium]
DLSWTGLPEFKDDTVTDYSRPSPTIESSSNDAQNKNSSVTKIEASHSTISSKPFIKFVKAADRPTEDKTDKKETAKKPTVKYAELYRRTLKSSKRVKMLEKELKARTSPTKFYKVDRGRSRPSLVKSFDQEKNNIQAQQKKKMVKTSSSSKNEPCCSKACKKNTKSLNSKITDLEDKLFDAKNMIYHYKLGMSQVESRLAEHKDREIKYCEKIRGLKFKTESSDEYIESLKKELELIKKEKKGLDNKLTGFQTASKDLDSLLESQRLDKNKDELGYSADDIMTDYSRHSPTIESSSNNAQNRNPSVTKTKASHCTISSKPFIKFMKAADRPTEDKTDKKETAKKPTVKLGVKIGRACSNNNNTHKSMPPRVVVYKTVKSPPRTNRSNMNVAQPRRTNFPKTRHSYVRRPFQETTQDLMIILIQIVKMLEKELKARTSPTKVYKVDRGRSRPVKAWVPKKV